MSLSTMDWSQAQMYIGGEWVDATAGSRMTVTNPATGEVVGSVPDGGIDSAAAAAAAAHAAFPAWAALSARARSDLLHRWYQLVREAHEDISRLLTSEQGKPLAEARAEMNYGADFILWYAEEAKRTYGQIVPASVPNKRIWALRHPVGVAAAITPWNFPCAMITRKAAPALAAGCTVVIKPASQTPLTAVALVKLAEQAGIPPGVINLVTGSRAAAISDVWLSDERVRKISFTGSTEVGKILMRKAADQMKRISLELGGHAPVLVFDDADLDVAVAGAMACKFRNAGQACIAGNRFLVDERVAEAFVAKLRAAVAGLVVGPGSDEGTTVGPLIDQPALAKVEEHIADAVASGARVVAGGKRLDGNFFEPTVLSGVTTDMLIAREETFGPVIPVMTFRTEEEAIRLANDSPYGLAAYVFTRDLARSIRVAEALEYGVIGLNDGAPSTAQAPFGGFKDSGLGREGGPWGIEEYLEVKFVSVGLGPA